MGLIDSVETPKVLLIKDGNDITGSLNDSLVSIEYIDAIDNEVDGLTLVFSQLFSPPNFGDKLLVSIGFGWMLEFIGIFYVVSYKEMPKAGTMEVKLTPVDFSKGLKEKRSEAYKHVTLEQMLKKIGGRHGLSVKYDIKKIGYTYKGQSGESDLSFMKRLAKEVNATFSIKNGTILFRPKSLDGGKDKLPQITLSLEQLVDLEIEYLDKTNYKSGEAKFHHHKKAKTVVVKIGSEKPKLVIHGHYKDEAEAKTKLQAAINKENAGTVRGKCTVTTIPVIAGAMLTINTGYKTEPDLQIKEVRHHISARGYTKEIQFTK